MLPRKSGKTWLKRSGNALVIGEWFVVIGCGAFDERQTMNDAHNGADSAKLWDSLIDMIRLFEFSTPRNNSIFKDPDLMEIPVQIADGIAIFYPGFNCTPINTFHWPTDSFKSLFPSEIFDPFVLWNHTYRFGKSYRWFRTNILFFQMGPLWH